MAAKDSKVVTLDEEPELTTAVPNEAAPVTEVLGTNHDDELCGDKVKIEIYEAEGDGGKDDVTVQINGYAYKIKRGEEVVVPAEVLHVLENATMTLYENKPGGGHGERRVKRYAYSVLGNLPKAK